MLCSSGCSRANEALAALLANTSVRGVGCIVGKGSKVGRLTLASILSALMWFSGPAAARRLPTVLATIKCVPGCTALTGVYRVRPRLVMLIEAYGGELRLRWSSWSPVAAVGSGTGYFIGAGASYHYHVRVRASRARRGRFTRLTVVSTTRGKTYREHLHLGVSYGSPSWLR